MTGPEVTQPDPDGGVEMTDGEWAAFRGVEVTAAMKAEDVDAALVEKASNALSMLRHGIPGEYSDHTRTEVRHALAAVVPEIQAQALEDYAWALETARAAWENVTTLDAIPDDLRKRAADLRGARVATTTEGPTTTAIQRAAREKGWKP